jgi:hypothetical protein
LLSIGIILYKVADRYLTEHAEIDNAIAKLAESEKESSQKQQTTDISSKQTNILLPIMFL